MKFWRQREVDNSNAIQEAVRAAGRHFYGDGGTIHSNGEVNVELDSNGEVVAVWFRCLMLPFTQTVVDNSRADQMRSASGLLKLSISGVAFNANVNDG